MIEFKDIIRSNLRQLFLLIHDFIDLIVTLCASLKCLTRISCTQLC